MVQAQELRIGNWVLYKDQNDNPEFTPINICVPDLVIMREQKSGESDYGIEYKPIPITPEILEKAGFEKDIQMMMPIDLLSGRERFHVESGKATIVCGRGPHLVWLDFECKHLHQLQNLYFALTGQELTIKL